MIVSSAPELIPVNDLNLDCMNPRLGRHFHRNKPSQEELLTAMADWKLEELAVSFIESGFWSQESLVVVEEGGVLVVVEGNRRLAALKKIHQAAGGEVGSRRWSEIADGVTKDTLRRLTDVPCLRADSRGDVQSYIGFRHVTGIKEWAPAEKAAFIARLIDEDDLSYGDVMRRIGSKTPTVRQHYIAYRLLIQMENEVPAVSISHVEERFSVMYLSLRSAGTQGFLGIDIRAEPKAARRPVPGSRLGALQKYALWLFGDDEQEPVVRDSRQIDKFGKVLGSKPAVAYLERAPQGKFDVAVRIAGGEESEVLEHVGRAADEVEEALSTAHRYRKSRKLRVATVRLGLGVMRLIDLFPELRQEIVAEGA